MNSTFAPLLAAAVLVSSLGAGCGGGGGAEPKTAASETPPADLPASTKAETKTDPAFASCHNAYKPASSDQDVAADVAAHVLPALGAGRLQIPVYDTFPLAEAEAAYDHFAAGAKFGKVVLVAP